MDEDFTAGLVWALACFGALTLGFCTCRATWLLLDYIHMRS